MRDRSGKTDALYNLKQKSEFRLFLSAPDFEKHPQNWNLNSEQVAGHFEKMKLFSKTHLLFARKVPS